MLGILIVVMLALFTILGLLQILWVSHWDEKEK